MPALPEFVHILPRQSAGNFDTEGVGADTTGNDDSDSSLPGGAIAGIVVGVVFFVAAIVIGGWWYHRKKRRQSVMADKKKMSVDGRSSMGTQPSTAAAQAPEQGQRTTANVNGDVTHGDNNYNYNNEAAPDMTNTASKDYAAERPRGGRGANDLVPPPAVAASGPAALGATPYP